jgi:hypothetical protein
MQKQVDIVLRPFLDLMDCFKLFKVHNMVALMLDLCFKDLSLMGDYVGHFFTIEIVVAYDSSSSKSSRPCIKNYIDG